MTSNQIYVYTLYNLMIFFQREANVNWPVVSSLPRTSFRD